MRSQLIDEGLEKAHVPFSYGFAIITLTVLVKIATFPLSQKQVRPPPCVDVSCAGASAVRYFFCCAM